MDNTRKHKFDHIPLTVIDTRTQKPEIVNKPQRIQKGELTAEDFLPTLEMLLNRLLDILQKLLIALKYRFFKMLDKLFEDVEVPWLKIIAVLLIGYIVMKKDFQFNLSFNSPFSIFTDDQNSGNEYAKVTTFSTIESNPYAPISAKTLQDKKALAFIDKYKETAIAEMKKFGIPASIKMAQALIESRAGESYLAVNNNNFFGMKCFSKKCKKGHCTNATDDHHKDFFRNYKSVQESWRSHSSLISQGRYAKLAQYGKDYKKWATGLKKAGYATDKNYAKKLINTIEKYRLYQLDM
jgi:flagellum-specific peptidoglycan hydrolase FlgJ